MRGREGERDQPEGSGADSVAGGGAAAGADAEKNSMTRASVARITVFRIVWPPLAVACASVY